jgi:hypothetical protein
MVAMMAVTVYIIMLIIVMMMTMVQVCSRRSQGGGCARCAGAVLTWKHSSNVCSDLVQCQPR